MVTMLYSSSVQIRVSTRDLMKEKNGSVCTTSQRVGGLVTDCPVLGGDGRVSDQRGSLLGVGRDGGTQRCGHIGVFWKKTKSPNFSGGSKVCSRMCSATKCRHGLERIAFNELRRQPPVPEGTLDHPFIVWSVFTSWERLVCDKLSQRCLFLTFHDRAFIITALFCHITFPPNPTTISSSQPSYPPSACPSLVK